jgi:hypothetical protein
MRKVYTVVSGVKFNANKNFPEAGREAAKTWFDFKTEEGEKIKIKVALSPVSMDGALQTCVPKHQVGILTRSRKPVSNNGKRVA